MEKLDAGHWLKDQKWTYQCITGSFTTKGSSSIGNYNDVQDMGLVNKDLYHHFPPFHFCLTPECKNPSQIWLLISSLPLPKAFTSIPFLQKRKKQF